MANTYGGKRQGAGRKALTPEEKAAKEQAIIAEMVNELIYPALVNAYKSEPGRFGERCLSIYVSATEIREAYGAVGLAEWNSYFVLEKTGGMNRFGEGYSSLWKMKFAKYMTLKAFVEASGGDMKNVDKLEFPTQAMAQRLAKNRQKAAEKRARLGRTGMTLQKEKAKVQVKDVLAQRRFGAESHMVHEERAEYKLNK